MRQLLRQPGNVSWSRSLEPKPPTMFVFLSLPIVKLRKHGLRKHGQSSNNLQRKIKIFNQKFNWKKYHQGHRPQTSS